MLWAFLWSLEIWLCGWWGNWASCNSVQLTVDKLSRPLHGSWDADRRINPSQPLGGVRGVVPWRPTLSIHLLLFFILVVLNINMDLDCLYERLQGVWAEWKFTGHQLVSSAQHFSTVQVFMHVVCRWSGGRRGHPGLPFLSFCWF